MTDLDTTFGWLWFREEMRGCSAIGEREAAPLLDLVGECDRLVSLALNRPTSYASDRPQDFVVSILVVRSFRLMISSVQLALSGYVDSTPNVDRTVWEIGIRLLDIQSNPVGASLGYLLQGSVEKMGTMEVELAYRQKERLPTANLPRNLESERAFLRQLRAIAQGRGLDPEDIQKSHGKLNVRRICQEAGIEKAYLVDYAHDSSHVHEKDVATDFFYSETTARRNFELGPLQYAIPHAIADSLMNLARVLAFAADILEDSALGSGAAQLLTTLEARMNQLGMGDKSP